MVLEFEQGGDLYQLFKMRDGKFAEKAARFYIAQMTLALEAIHAQRIMFRDLKLENCLLSAQGNLKLCDFGLAKLNITECDSGSSSLVGTLEYLAPELVAEKSAHGYAVDWWALGVLSHELLTGKPIYHSKMHDESQIVKRILQEPVTLSPSLSVEAASTLALLLDKNPRTRLGSARGASEIKERAFFVLFDWTECAEQKMRAPWVPSLKSGKDVSMFDNSFTSLPLSASAHFDQTIVANDAGDDSLWDTDFPNIEL